MRIWMITGANRGIGLHIARAALEAGDSVVVTGRDLAKLRQAFDGYEPSRVLPLEVDITSADKINTAVETAINTFGKIDILVNNAGYGQLGPFEENSPTDVERQFETNVFGLFNMCRAVLPVMRHNRRGHIFNIASIAGLVGMPGASVYSASKFAVAGFSESLAQEVFGFGVKVTLVAPGAFRTDFLDASSAQFGSEQLSEYQDFSNKIRSSSASHNHNQQGDPEKLGKAFVKLALNANAPLRFMAGTDAFNLAESRFHAREEEAQRWKELTCSTDA